MTSWFSNVSDSFSRQGSNPSVNAAPINAVGIASSSKPLEAQFDRKKVRYPERVGRAENYSNFLATNFKASAGKFALLNVQPSPVFHGYGSHKPQSVTIREKIPGDRLDMTISTNVSGHDLKNRPNRKELLAQRAKGNSYAIRVTHPDGRTEKLSNIKANGDLFTAMDISISGMVPGKTIVETWPEQSAGVSGYVEGRRLEINYEPPVQRS